MASTVATSLSGDYRSDALLGAQHWAAFPGATSAVVTYSFPDTLSVWSTAPGDYGAGDVAEPGNGFAALTTSEQGAVRAALSAWAAVANVTFAQVADNDTSQGTIRFGWTEMSAALQSYTYPPGTLQKSGDVWLNTVAVWDGLDQGSYGYSTLLHEIGHALGLKDSSQGAVTLPAGEDSYASTLMSANAFVGSVGSWVNFEPTTPMPYDILAAQALYGANRSYHSGDDTYTFTQGASYFQTIWDAGGNDTIAWDGSTQGVTIDLRAGHFSTLGNPLTYYSEDLSSSWSDQSTVAIAYGVTIENAVGGDANDVLIGNDGGDTFTGRGGDDTIVGGAGLDQAMYNSARAQNTVQVLASGDISVTGPEGADTLHSIERVVFSDVALGFDLNGSGGEAYRLYQAAFDRSPDEIGLGYWIDHLDKGQTLPDVAANFVASAEFHQLYGLDPSNDQFIALLYQNVLHRAPDQAGLDYWRAAMVQSDQQHASDSVRATVLIQFSESTENQANVLGSIQNGLEYVPWHGG